MLQGKMFYINMDDIHGNVHWLDVNGVDMEIFSQYGPDVVYNNKTQVVLSYTQKSDVFTFNHQKLVGSNIEEQIYNINKEDMKRILETLTFHKINFGQESNFKVQDFRLFCF